MRYASGADIPLILALVKNHRDMLVPIPSEKTLRGLVRKGGVIFDSGVLLISKMHDAPYWVGKIHLPASVEVTTLVSRFQGRGYALAIMRQFLEVTPVVTLCVFAGNERANAFYQKLGFVLVGSKIWSAGEVNYYVKRPV